MGCEINCRGKQGVRLLALAFMVLTVAAHAEVYKWVDENGQTRYADKPPKQGNHTQLRVPTAPQGESVPSASSAPVLSDEEWNRKGREEHQKNMEQMDRFVKERAEKDRAEREARERAERERQAMAKKSQQEQAAKQQARDDELVAECRRNRENYCDKGVETIRSEQERLRIWQEDEEKKARTGGSRRIW